MELGFYNPEYVAELLGITPGDKIADFGSGAGHIAILLAKKTGPEGQIFAIDIQKEALEVLQSRARLEGLLNIKTIWGNLEKIGGSKVDDGSVDLVFISNILFQAPQKDVIIKEAIRVLKPGGRIALIEWKIEKDSPLGPPPEARISPDAVKSICESNGLKLASEFDAGSHHYGMVFIK
ncbi:MAG: methyltransferase domain-containing protein [Patescibacteria group bacterium]